jgi:hypothetical protein
MKHFKTLVLFLLIFFVGQWVITISFDSITSKSSFRFSKLYSKSTKMNNTILCVGNSRGVNSFYTPYINKEYSTKSFNLSFNGMHMPMVDLFLEDYLKNHQSPKTVFIEVSNIFNSNSKINYSTFNLYSNKSKRLAKEIKVTDYKTYLISSIFPLYRFNSELFYRSLIYLGKSDQNWINRYNISKILEADILKTKPFNLEINNSDLNILKQTIKMLKKNGINVILFVAPYHPNYLLKIMNLKSMIVIIENATDVPVQDISGYLTKTEYFADRVHTNESGARLIADTLMKLTTCNNVYKK